MTISAGNYAFGPENATLRVKTGRRGAAAKAGHDLVIEVGAWQATLGINADGTGALGLTADAKSLQVVEGSGGAKPLGDRDRADILKSIDRYVLKGHTIVFRSTEVSTSGDGLAVSGELTIRGAKQPVSFTVSNTDEAVSGGLRIDQRRWGIKPHSALFGAMRVDEHVAIEVEGRLPRVPATPTGAHDGSSESTSPPTRSDALPTPGTAASAGGIMQQHDARTPQPPVSGASEDVGASAIGPAASDTEGAVTGTAHNPLDELGLDAKTTQYILATLLHSERPVIDAVRVTGYDPYSKDASGWLLVTGRRIVVIKEKLIGGPEHREILWSDVVRVGEPSSGSALATLVVRTRAGDWRFAIHASDGNDSDRLKLLGMAMGVASRMQIPGK